MRPILIAVSVVAVAALVVLYFFDPATSSFYPICPLLALTGYKCAGCGMTRAMHQLLHGHVHEALRLNAGMVAMLPVIGIGAATRPRAFAQPRVIGSIVALLLVWAIVRNLIGL